MQADTPDFDARTWIFLIFAAISVIGSLLGKKKKEEAEAAKRGQKQRRPAPGRPRQPGAPQPPRPPRVAGADRPQRAPLPTPPTPGLPEIRATRPRPAETRSRPAAAPPGRLVARPAARARPVQPQVELAPVELEPEVLPISAIPIGEAALAAPARGAGPGIELSRVRRLLSDKSGLRSAFILSEILAPAVGLRDNHLF